MEESRGSASSPATGMAVGNPIEELYISIFGVDGPQHDSEARSEHRIPKAPAKFREYEKDNKYFDPWVVSLGPYHHGEDHVTLSQMEESRGIASSPATRMADEHEEFVQEALRNPSDEWFISKLDGQQPDREGRSKHRIQKAPDNFREYGKDKNYFDPQVVSLGPYHRDDKQIKLTSTHKITAAKQFIDGFKNVTGGRGGIYKKFKELTGKKLKEWKECYDAEVVADMSDDDFAQMMFSDGCFILRFIEERNGEEAETILEISNDKIPLIIRDMFLIENQLPFEVLDALMNLRWGSSSTGKQNILKFINSDVLIPMGMFYPLNSSRPSKWCSVVDGGEHDSPLHLLDILRTILLDFPPSKGWKKQRYRLHNFGSVMELKEFGIRFERRNMNSLLGIIFEERLLFPRLLLPKLIINDTTISQLLNLTALEACSDTYSGCGVTSFIHFMDSLIKDEADVKKLRSKGILHSLRSDNEVASLLNTWPADVTNNLQRFISIIKQIDRHSDRRVKISIATSVDKYFGSPQTAISLMVAGLVLVFTAIQAYSAAFGRR